MTPLAKPVRRMSQAEYGYGSHKRRYVVTLSPGAETRKDLITIKPHGLRSGAFTMTLDSVYQWMVRSEAGKLALEKARAVKAKKAERLARQREQRAEARLTLPL